MRSLHGMHCALEAACCFLAAELATVDAVSVLLVWFD